MTSASSIQESIVNFTASEFECVALPDGRVACDTALIYPSGDSVVVFAAVDGDRLIVTDYGVGVDYALERPGAKRRQVSAYGQSVCRDFDLDFVDSRISVHGRLGAVGDLVWRVASASLRIAGANSSTADALPSPASDFTYELEHAIRSRNVMLTRGQRLAGLSGHEHEATLYVPSIELVIEPIQGSGTWARASAVYVEFGDLSSSNGFRLLSVLDDRTTPPAEEVLRLLAQVSIVGEWSRREEWLNTALRTP